MMKANLGLIILVALGLIFAGCLGGESESKSADDNNLSQSSRTPGFGQFANDAKDFEEPSLQQDTQPTQREDEGKEKQQEQISKPKPQVSEKIFVDPAKAIKISMLRRTERFSFASFMIKLNEIYYKGGPRAKYELLDAQGKKIQGFELGINETFRFTAADGVEYLIAAVFVVGEGIPNAVQTQVYRVQDLRMVATSERIGPPENIYVLRLQYPSPLVLANQSVEIGQTVLVPKVLSAQLVGIDQTIKPPVATVRILDANGDEIGITYLQNGQMSQVKLDDNSRYEVALLLTDAQSKKANIIVYKVLALQGG